MSVALQTARVINIERCRDPRGRHQTHSSTRLTALSQHQSACRGLASAPSGNNRRLWAIDCRRHRRKTAFRKLGDEDLMISETTIGQDPDSVFGVIGTDYDDDNTLARESAVPST